MGVFKLNKHSNYTDVTAISLSVHSVTPEIEMEDDVFLSPVSSKTEDLIHNKNEALECYRKMVAAEVRCSFYCTLYKL